MQPAVNTTPTTASAAALDPIFPIKNPIFAIKDNLLLAIRLSIDSTIIRSFRPNSKLSQRKVRPRGTGLGQNIRNTHDLALWSLLLQHWMQAHN